MSPGLQAALAVLATAAGIVATAALVGVGWALAGRWVERLTSSDAAKTRDVTRFRAEADVLHAIGCPVRLAPPCRCQPLPPAPREPSARERRGGSISAGRPVLMGEASRLTDEPDR